MSYKDLLCAIMVLIYSNRFKLLFFQEVYCLSLLKGELLGHRQFNINCDTDWFYCILCGYRICNCQNSELAGGSAD